MKINDKSTMTFEACLKFGLIRSGQEMMTMWRVESLQVSRMIIFVFLLWECFAKK